MPLEIFLVLVIVAGLNKDNICFCNLTNGPYDVFT